MLFYCKEDFYARSAKSRKLSRKSEKECALMMKQGDATAREKIIISYLPAVAAYVRKMPARMQTYALICRFVAALEKAVDTFDFLQDNEAFLHRLSFVLRKESVSHIAEYGVLFEVEK